MAKKVVVNKGVCIGCGLCAATCPSVFEIDDDGLAKAAEVIDAADEAAADEAAANCPVQAIEAE